MSSKLIPSATKPARPAKALPLSGLPAAGFIRERGLISIIPVSSATLWRWVRSGAFVQPVRLGANVTAWRVEDVQDWINAQAGGSAK